MVGRENGRQGTLLKLFKVSGESGDVQGETVDSWKERVPELLSGYRKEDMWNMDETGNFWRALPDNGVLGRKERLVRGAKRANKE